MSILVYLTNAFLFSMALGSYIVMLCFRWKRSKLATKVQFTAVALLLVYLVYGYIEAAVDNPALGFRHFMSIGVATFFIGTMIFTVLDEHKYD